ncbi:MAG: hypothetical protein ACE5JU_22485, partial [Candidatus Binatia bacterium]
SGRGGRGGGWRGEGGKPVIWGAGRTGRTAGADPVPPALPPEPALSEGEGMAAFRRLGRREEPLFDHPQHHGSGPKGA